MVSVLALYAFFFGASADIEARLDRSTIFFGEAVNLYISARGGAGLRPDLKPLEADFRILDTANSTRMRFSQGASKASSEWIISLEPQREGQLTIPAIEVGEYQTPAMALRVLPAAKASGSAEPPVRVELEVETSSPYVQQKVLLIQRLLHRVPIIEGDLERPNLSDALVEKLGEDVSFERVVDGESYRVVERRYLLFPQRSGRLEIPALAFRGRIVDQDTEEMAFFRRGKAIAVESERTVLDVRPAPASFTGDTWLPAADIQLSASRVETEEPLRAGEPQSLEIELVAEGLLHTQLPEVEIPDIPNIAFYPEPPEIRTRATETSVRAERKRKIAMVPSAEGTYSLPPIEIHWWDIDEDRERIARIEPQDFLVAAPELESRIPESSGPGNSDATSTTVRRWQVLSALFAGLWLSTLLLFWLRRLPQSPVAAPAAPLKRDDASGALADACAANDPGRAEQALRRWARVEHHADSLESLPDDEDLELEIDHLLRARYRSPADDWDRGQQLLQAVKRYNPAPSNCRLEPVLPPLYPS